METYPQVEEGHFNSSQEVKEYLEKFFEGAKVSDPKFAAYRDFTIERDLENQLHLVQLHSLEIDRFAARQRNTPIKGIPRDEDSHDRERLGVESNRRILESEIALQRQEIEKNKWRLPKYNSTYNHILNVHSELARISVDESPLETSEEKSLHIYVSTSLEIAETIRDKVLGVKEI